MKKFISPTLSELFCPDQFDTQILKRTCIQNFISAQYFHLFSISYNRHFTYYLTENDLYTLFFLFNISIVLSFCFFFLDLFLIPREIQDFFFFSFCLVWGRTNMSSNNFSSSGFYPRQRWRMSDGRWNLKSDRMTEDENLNWAKSFGIEVCGFFLFLGICYEFFQQHFLSIKKCPTCVTHTSF